jgi:hypothetical protein
MCFTNIRGNDLTAGMVSKITFNTEIVYHLCPKAKVAYICKAKIEIQSIKPIIMKKILLLVVMLATGIVMLSSCAGSKRGTGCPMTENIIH